MGQRHGLPDPREILAVSSDASVEQINAAYRAALRRLHPDTRHTSDYAIPAHQIWSMAELQAARRALLERAADREGDPAVRADARSTSSARDQAGPPQRSTAPEAPLVNAPRRPAGRRSWYPGEPDIIAGPTRYHGWRR
jgi:hypothetical protein